jgi:hypothetical protein
MEVVTGKDAITDRCCQKQQELLTYHVVLFLQCVKKRCE